MITLNYRDSRPIYEQIKDGLRRLVMSGAIEPDEKLPSVRELAGSLAINPNTIQRAYRDLEAEGCIYSVAGKGSFAKGGDELRGRHISRLLDSFDSTAAELLTLGLTHEALAERIGNFSNKEADAHD